MNSYMKHKPVQARSKATVESILDAAEVLLENLKPCEISTDMIALNANISIGSIYQFFSNREQIFCGVIDRMLGRDRHRLLSRLGTNIIDECKPLRLLSLVEDISLSQLFLRLKLVDHCLGDLKSFFSYFREIVLHECPQMEESKVWLLFYRSLGFQFGTRDEFLTMITNKGAKNV